MTPSGAAVTPSGAAAAPGGLPVERVLARVRAAAERAGRDPAGVRLVAVTKGHTPHEIRARVLAHGPHPLGESRIQEALPKLEALPGVELHLIGHLQTNKARFARPFALLHSLDSLRLAEALARQAQRWGEAPPALVEVNVLGETTKHGVSPAEAPGLVRAARELGLSVRGLMAMAPFGDPARARRTFRELRLLRDTLGLEELSMGMSDDFEAAVEEGSTLVRVGRALFEDEPGEGA